MRKRLHCRGEAHRDSDLAYRIRLGAELGVKSLVGVLAHEMIHVAQWLTGQMEDLHEQRYTVRWGKRNYHPASIAYRRHPWEIHAFKHEKKLLNGFLEFWRTK